MHGPSGSALRKFRFAGAFIVLTGLLVIALLVEALPHRPGWLNRLKRLAIAIAVGIVVGTLTFGAAFLGLYLSCPFF